MVLHQDQKQYNDIEQSERLITKLLRERAMRIFLLLCAFGLGLMLVTSILPVFKDAPSSLLTQIMQQIGIALFVTSIVSITVANLIDNTRNQLENQINAFLQSVVTGKLDEIQKNLEYQTKQLEDDISKELAGIEEGIKQQTERFVDTSASLQAMGESGISEMYLKRDSAIADLRNDLTNREISKIRLIGISLNDFVRDGGVFHETWRVIAEYARGDREPPTPGRKLDIQILLIDPICQGAYLRSGGEQRGDSITFVQSRLAKDVDFTVGHLAELEQAANGKGEEARVSFDFRLYQLPPMLFLLWTDSASYIQPYYFWRSRDPAIPLPLLRYNGESLIHRGMKDHFDWIWNNASVSSDDYFQQHRIGVDKGLHQSGVINVYDDPEEAKKRILALMEGTKERLYIQGLSLRSFFDGESVLYRTIKRLAEQNTIDIKILLIKPDSEQAHYRSFREHLMENPESSISFEQFKEGIYRSAQLYRDTGRSVRWLRRIASLDTVGSLFSFKWHDTAPYCFMLIVDDSVLVEQYHYGKVGPLAGSTTLGKDMARFEYARQPLNPYDADKALPTYELLKSHFDFVFNDCAEEIPLSFFQDTPSNWPNKPPLKPE